MKRLLLTMLLAGSITHNMLGTEKYLYNYYATYTNPTRIVTFKEKEASGGTLQIPAFVTKAKVGKTQTTKSGKRQVVHTQVDLIKALESPETADYSISKSMDGNLEVFTVCIKKGFIPGFDPSLGDKNVWGLMNYANVEDKGAMWCFTLKNNQGYTKMPIVQQ